MEPRTVTHRYRDPLAHIWLATAEAIGLRVVRSGEVYASTDGRGALTIGTDDTLDADDSLAQMIFHELCHSLIEGPGAFQRPDWGLDNIGDRDVPREHACLRVQAALGHAYGLRQFFAPTTDFRAFYDALDDDPLAPRTSVSSALATAGLRNADLPPWAPHLARALEATATIAAATHEFRRDEAPPALWARVDPAPPRHPLGFPAAYQRDGSQRCASCAWSYRGGRTGKPLARCRQAGGARIQPDWPGCDRWEPALDCERCGACCRGDHRLVPVRRSEPLATRHPHLLDEARGSLVVARITGNDGREQCAALEPRTDPATGLPRWPCRVYDDRPSACRTLERHGEACLAARRRLGLSR